MNEVLEDDVPAEDPSGTGESDESHWLFLVDPAWTPPAAGSAEPDPMAGADVPMPPREAIVGGWLVGPDGEAGQFHPNPEYVPSSAGSPTDPVDATLQMVMNDEAPIDDLLPLLADMTYGVALDEEGAPLCLPSPDGVLSLVVATAPARRVGVEEAAGWAEVPAAELAELVTGSGADLLINPIGPATIRLIGEVFVEEVAAAAVVDADGAESAGGGELGQAAARAPADEVAGTPDAGEGAGGEDDGGLAGL